MASRRWELLLEQLPLLGGPDGDEPGPQGKSRSRGWLACGPVRALDANDVEPRLRSDPALAPSNQAKTGAPTRQGDGKCAAAVRMRFSGLSPEGAATLGCLVTLTPGTTTVDVDMERGELLLHLLDASDPAEKAAGIRRGFERRLQALFPAHERP